MHRITRFIIVAAVIAGATTVVRPSIASAQAQRDAMVITPAKLHDELHDANLVLLHIGTKPGYDSAHIAGARYVDFTDLALPRDTTRGALSLEMPEPGLLHDRLMHLGITDKSHVVIYYGGDWVSPSTRVVMTLRYAGLGAHASILDGGMAAWKAAGFPVTTEVGNVRITTLAPLQVQPVIVTGDWVRAHLSKPGIAIVDARAPAFYDGVSGMGKHGHLPGALSVPFDSSWTKENVLKSPDQLRAIFAHAGVRQGDTIVGYCHIGQQATAMLFAAQTLGYTTLLYDGSFEDWANHGWPVDTVRHGGGR